MSLSITCPHCGQKFDVDESRAGLAQVCPVCIQPVTVPGVENRFPGSQASDRFQFPLRSVLNAVALLFVILLLIALFLPAVRGSREAARRNQCINNLKNLGLSLHNHHDIHSRFPLASSEPRTGRPGMGTGPNPAGYSWLVALLPFMEEVMLWDTMVKETNGLRIPPFDPAGKPELSCVNIQILRCPSNGGPDRVRNGDSEYHFHDWPLQPGKATPTERVTPAVSCYVALAASHFTNSAGLGMLFDSGSPQDVDGNGLLAFPVASGRSINKGLGLKAAIDGVSKTVVLAETKEQTYAAWIDGQATWVIGAWQGDSQVPSANGAADGFLSWPETDTTSGPALNVGSRIAEQAPDSYRPSPPDKVYLTAERYGAGVLRSWGPSSEHTGGAVNHVFADGHVTSIVGAAIDRNVYLRIISRDGGESLRFD